MDENEWEHIYRVKAGEQMPEPSALLQKHAHLLCGGTALDIAMGMGHNALFLARSGCRVTGVDRSTAAVTFAHDQAAAAGLPVNAVEADMLGFPFSEDGYDVITNFYFLERSLLPLIKKNLKKNGLVFFETYTRKQARFGRPRNPDHLLETNELLSAFLDCLIVFYHERIEEDRAVASLIARKL
ncbi:MAG: class I SAM-dependent methyltransferase [Deltaproteobacteria bacterium]|nr:class I SAM-dependent methyltransferase [Deltaproteobacteria bacterium]